MKSIDHLLMNRAVSQPVAGSRESLWEFLAKDYSEKLKAKGDVLLNPEEQAFLKIFLEALSKPGSGAGILALPKDTHTTNILSRLWLLMFKVKKRIVIITPEDTAQRLYQAYSKIWKSSGLQLVLPGGYFSGSKTTGYLTIFSQESWCKVMRLKDRSKGVMMKKGLSEIMDPDNREVAIICYGLNYKISDILARSITHMSESRMVVALDYVREKKKITMPLKPTMLIKSPKKDAETFRYVDIPMDCS